MDGDENVAVVGLRNSLKIFPQSLDDCSSVIELIRAGGR